MTYQYLLERVNANGCTEQVWFTGSQRDRPKGWCIVGRRPHMFTVAGLA